MKWIKGKWDKTSNTIYVNPAFITAIDIDRQLLWADDCDVAVRYDITFNLEETSYADNISFSISDTYNATVKTDENTQSGVVSLDSIANEETVTLRVTVEWNDSSTYDSNDTELGIEENQIISVPINIRLNQYFGEEIVEYEGQKRVRYY